VKDSLVKHPGGRPLKLQNRRKVQETIDEYFTKCEEEKTPVTLMGLCIALDARISDLIKRAHRRVAEAYEKRGMTAQNPAFPIFVLKNMGWTDKQDIDINARLHPSSYTEEEETELRELARLRAAKAITTGSSE
jgi:hypothetical protein